MLKELSDAVEREPAVKRAPAWRHIEALLAWLGARGPGSR
jgi:hypothetical protein